jgi:hypothetical protein
MIHRDEERWFLDDGDSAAANEAYLRYDYASSISDCFG